jgi:hypothetical protein
MTFTELKAELEARGFDHLSDTRLGQYVNQARAELDGMHMWPYREASVTGAAPLAVTDCVRVEQVVDADTDRVLQPSDYSTLLEAFQDNLTTAGSPLYFYVGTPSGVPTIGTYPVGTGNIEVQYYARTTDLSAGSDEPACPDEYHLLICDLAQVRALRDSDEFGSAESLRSSVERDLERMRFDLLLQHQGPMFQKTSWTSASDW